jgi:hypothetical protein
LVDFQREHLEKAKRFAQDSWRESWLLRWTLANMAGWSVGLIGAALLLNWFGVIGAMLGGAAAGALVGALQAWALHTHGDLTLPYRRWISVCALAGALAMLPVALLGFVALLNPNVGLLLMGAIYGLALGSAQAFILHAELDTDAGAVLWVAACVAAGALCAPLSISASAAWLPVCCSPGPLVFGLITGAAWLKLPRDSDV